MNNTYTFNYIDYKSQDYFICFYFTLLGILCGFNLGYCFYFKKLRKKPRLNILIPAKKNFNNYSTMQTINEV